MTDLTWFVSTDGRLAAQGTLNLPLIKVSEAEILMMAASLRGQWVELLAHEL